jgi:hypothetical protein
MLCGASLGLLTAANMHYFLMIVPFVAIIMIVPLPFGVRESIGGVLFALAGFDANAAIVMGFLASLVGVAVSMAGGVLLLGTRMSARRTG